MGERPEFQCGIVMAGAISAGAYSAGVMDFFMEALDAYDKAKAQPEWNGPTHDVRVPVMAGASAGGMTAAIAALHSFREIEHVRPGKPVPAKPANRLYSSWVTDISIERLLETTDLATGQDRQGVKSALCCAVLDEIVNNAIIMSGALRQPNWVGRGQDRTLRVLLTLTNVRGVPYSFSVFGADARQQFGMLNHGDYLGFTAGIGAPQGNDSHFLDVANPAGDEWDLFKTAALATGAFPVGLAPRLLKRPPTDYEDALRVRIDDPNDFKAIPPGQSFDRKTPYTFVSVDGGTIDNEPLELARQYLAGNRLRNDRNGETASKAVILIAPFPNFARMPEADANERLTHVVPQLFSALIDQARFNPEELALAENDAVFSRFIVSPIRPSGDNPHAQKYPIASGSLGGFGGFIHESFRRHDYLLGRRNAQAFLRWNFSLPETNPLFDEFRGNREPWYVREPMGGKTSIQAEDDINAPKKMFAKTVNGAPDTPGLPIVPLTEALRAPIEIGAEDLPKPNDVAQDLLEQKIEKRAKAVVGVLVDVDLISVTKSSWIFGRVLRFGARQYGTQLVTNKAQRLVRQAIEDVRQAFMP